MVKSLDYSHLSNNVMPIEFPKPKHLRGAGYAPIQEDIPKLPLPAVSDVEVQPTPEYECKIKIHASKSVLDALQTGLFSIENFGGG